MEYSCQDFINPIMELQQAKSNVRLAWVPREKKHSPMTIIKKGLEATTNVIKSRALKNIVPLITHMHAWAERKEAATSMKHHPSGMEDAWPHAYHSKDAGSKGSATAAA